MSEKDKYSPDVNKLSSGKLSIELCNSLDKKAKSGEIMKSDEIVFAQQCLELNELEGKDYWFFDNAEGRIDFERGSIK
jgi:hypothetical protein